MHANPWPEEQRDASEGFVKEIVTIPRHRTRRWRSPARKSNIDDAMLERDQRELIGMVIAAMVAAIGVAGMLLTDLRTNAGPDADLITASVVSRAGATSVPSERPIELGAPKTVPAFR